MELSYHLIEVPCCKLKKNTFIISRCFEVSRKGKRLEKRFVEYKGNHYLECKVEKTFEVNYFLENGAPIEKSAIEEFLPKKRESSTHYVAKKEKPIF